MKLSGCFNSIYLGIVDVRQLEVVIIFSFNVLSLKIRVIPADSGLFSSNNILLRNI
jgi:hypothetical protein